MKTKNILMALVLGAAVAGTAQAGSTYRFQLWAKGVRPTPDTSTITPPAYTYATLNPSDKASGATLSNGYLTESGASGAGARGTFGKASGKWYFEVSVDSLAGGAYPPVVGVANGSITLASTWAHGPGEYLFYGLTGQAIYGADQRFAYGGSVGRGDVIGVAVDLDNRQITFYRNGVSLGAAFTSTLMSAGTYYPYVSDPNDTGYTSQVTVNFGQSALRYAPPAGYNAGWYQ
jgi:hypothetical protein